MDFNLDLDIGQDFRILINKEWDQEDLILWLSKEERILPIIIKSIRKSLLMIKEKNNKYLHLSN